MRLAATALAFLAVSAGHADAVCVTFSTCVNYWQADAVFVGRVTGFRCAPRPADPFQPTMDEVHLEVVEAFRGVTTATVVLSESVCGGVVTSESVAFHRGETYFVQAHRNPKTGSLGTSICSTWPVRDAGPALEYARWIATRPANGWVSGIVRHWQWDPESDEVVSYPLPADLAVVLAGASGTSRTVLPGGGESATFRFDDVRPGTYELRLETPPSYEAVIWPEVDVGPPELCVEANVRLRWRGTIRGRVVDMEGRPVPACGVEITGRRHAAADHRHVDRAMTDDDGEFVLAGLGPGSYIVGIHLESGSQEGRPEPFYFPGVDDLQLARSISVTIGSDTHLGDFQLPVALEKVLLSGRVLNPDGTPAEAARVSAYSEDRSFEAMEQATLTDADGGYQLYGVRGRRYELHASMGGAEGSFSATVQVTAGAAPPVIRLQRVD